MILDGNDVSKRIKDKLALQVAALEQKGVRPCLATILVGDDPASATYVRMKGNACKRLGIESKKSSFLKRQRRRNCSTSFAS